MERIIYPKNATKIEAGEWAILACSLIESDDKFRKNPYGNYTFKGVCQEIDLFDSTEYKIYATEEKNERGYCYLTDYMLTDYSIETEEQQKYFLSTFLNESKISALSSSV